MSNICKVKVKYMQVFVHLDCSPESTSWGLLSCDTTIQMLDGTSLTVKSLSPRKRGSNLVPCTKDRVSAIPFENDWNYLVRCCQIHSTLDTLMCCVLQCVILCPYCVCKALNAMHLLIDALPWMKPKFVTPNVSPQKKIWQCESHNTIKLWWTQQY